MAGIVDGNPVNASYTNSKLASKDGDNTFIGKQTLNRAGSGATITDAQQTINTLITDVATAENDITNLQADVTTLQNLDTFIYGGVWNATTNSPTLADGDGGNGFGAGIVYRVSTAGTQNLGSGSITYAVGDKVVYNTLGVWEKWDVSDEVTSVNGKSGVVVTYDSANDNATGSNATLSAVTTTVVRLTNASLVSIDMVPAGASAYEFVLENKTSVTITINNETGATAANRILTGTGSNLPMLNDSSLKFVYDTTSSRWHVVGGAGGANKNLSNLDSPTSVNQSLLPSTSDTYDIGASGNRWSGIHADLYNLYDGGGSVQGRFKPTITSPTGLTTGIQLETVASTEPLILNTVNNASGNSGTVNIESGNSTSNNSGDIKLQTGTAGATRGKIYLKDGSEGTSGHIWTSTGTSGEGNWAAAPASGANTALSNLTTTSINQDLLPSASNVRSLGTTLLKWKELILNKISLYSSVSTYWTGSTSAILVENDGSPTTEFMIGSTDAASGTEVSKYTTIATGAQQANSSVGTGRVTVITGDQAGGASSGSTGDIQIYTGWHYGGSGNTGPTYVATGQISGGTGGSGLIEIESGDVSSSSTAASGAVNLQSGAQAGSGASGAVTVRSGTSSSGATGAVNINSGNSTSGNSGAITLQTGTAGGTRGNIVFKDGSEGTVGHVWTSTSTTGDGEWQAASGGGANTTLSNLGTTSINSSLIPATTLSIDLGSSGPKSFLGLYVRDIYKQDAVKIIDMLNSRILDASGNASIYYDSKYLITGPQGGPTIKLDWSGNLKAHVKIEPNATETLDLGTSSLYWNTLYITKVVVPTTVTGGGTTGNQTINKISGTVNFAAAATSLTVTNSFVAANSIVMAVVRTNDATASIKNVVPAAGSFTINLEAAATAETSVGFFVIN